MKNKKNVKIVFALIGITLSVFAYYIYTEKQIVQSYNHAFYKCFFCNLEVEKSSIEATRSQRRTTI